MAGIDIEELPPVANPTWKGPEAVTIKPGESKYLCMCGQSKNFPFCDGSHKKYNEEHGTKISPKVVTNEEEEEKTVYACKCGQSKSRPFCDGSHRAGPPKSE